MIAAPARAYKGVGARMLTLSTWLAAIWLGGAPPAAASATGDPSGRWRIALDPAALSATHADAVARAMAMLPWAIRPFARTPLSQVVKNCGALAIDVDPGPGRFTVGCDGDPALQIALGETGRTVTGHDGKPYTASVRRDGDAWSLVFASDDAGQTITFEALADGSLRLTKAITSRWLSEPVAWTVTYGLQAGTP